MGHYTLWLSSSLKQFLKNSRVIIGNYQRSSVAKSSLYQFRNTCMLLLYDDNSKIPAGSGYTIQMSWHRAYHFRYPFCKTLLCIQSLIQLYFVFCTYYTPDTLPMCCNIVRNMAEKLPAFSGSLLSQQGKNNNKLLGNKLNKIISVSD